MSKELIRQILRENTNQEESSTSTQYPEIQRKLDGTLLKAAQVMQAAGLGNADDATDRSLFSKKLRQEKNDEGGIYEFNEDELAKITRVINNPSAYLSKKNIPKDTQ
jgi:hypothetical protein